MFCITVHRNVELEAGEGMKEMELKETNKNEKIHDDMKQF